MTTCIYKVVRNIKHKQLGWIKLGRFVECRPEFAKNYVIRREMVRVSAENTKSLDVTWIDSKSKPVKEKSKAAEKPEPKVKIQLKTRKTKNAKK